MTKLKALIFDVDGTLAETERDAHRIAFNETFAAHELGWDWSVKLYGDLLAVTGGKERMKFYAKQYHPSDPPLTDQYIAELHKDKTARYNAMLVNNPIPLRPGVRRIIEEARAEGIRLAISTTTSPKNVSSLLENSLTADAMSWFEVVAAGDIVEAKKPASDIYDYALKELKLKPEECFAFEDSGNGIRSALGANIPTIITVNDYTAHENFTGAKLVLNNLGEPDQAFTVLAGDAGDAKYVDMAMLHKMI